MTSFHPHPMSSSTTTLNFDEQHWVINVRKTLDEELEEDSDVLTVSIYDVPKALLLSHPESYVPQHIAIGPYHRWRPELYEMERYKLVAAKRRQKQFEPRKFQRLVEEITRYDIRIRAAYHKYLNFNADTLAWMMAVDASFLLEFLFIYAAKEGEVVTRISSRMSHLVDIAGRKPAHNATLRDMVMLENQIPLFVLRKMLEFQFSDLDRADEILESVLMGFLKELSPFKMVQNLPKTSVTECCHLLDFLYRLIVPRLEIPQSEIILDEDGEDAAKDPEENPVGISKKVRNLMFSRPIKDILRLPWTIVSNFPAIRAMRQSIELLFFSDANDGDKNGPEKDRSHCDMNKPASVEEIAIPSVIELAGAGVIFVPSNAGILDINFDEKSKVLSLPILSVDITSEVVLRNLVAYEACSASGPVIFTRYTELMNGIIDTEEDAKFLREKGIIMNRLKSDREVANLCNGLSKSLRLTKVPCLDKTIEDVNSFYNGSWRVKIGNFMKHYVFESWRLLTFLAAILLLMLMLLQAFASIFYFRGK